MPESLKHQASAIGKYKGDGGVLWGKKWRREAELPQTSKLSKFLVLESQLVEMRL